MLAEEHLPTHPVLLMAGRLLFTSLFFLSGLTHFTNIPYYLDLMTFELPFPVVLVILTGVLELIGAAMILTGWRPKLGAWLLVIFLVPVTILVHGYGMVSGETELERAMQQAHFLKGIALTGAALLITQLGASIRRTAQSAS